jgi:hypothetical protein
LESFQLKKQPLIAKSSFLQVQGSLRALDPLRVARRAGKSIKNFFSVLLVNNYQLTKYKQIYFIFIKYKQ